MGSKAATLEDVAALAGVSRATVSRVVRGDHIVAEDTARSVREAVAELGYTPNTAARALAARRADTIALIVPEPENRLFSDPFFAKTVQGVSRSLEDTPIQLVMAFSDRAGADERLRAFLGGGRVDGAIITSHHQQPGQVELFTQARVPVVFIGRPGGTEEFHYWVDVDNVEAGRIAARRLIEGGVREPAIILGSHDMLAAQDRYDGFWQELAKHGLAPKAYQGTFTKASGAQAATAMVPQILAGEIDGVFASSDLMALGALEAWAQAGVRVPEDVRLVSVDDLAEGEESTPSLTSISNSSIELGKAATRMLLDRLDGHPSDGPLLVPAVLVPRESG